MDKKAAINAIRVLQAMALATFAVAMTLLVIAYVFNFGRHGMNTYPFPISALLSLHVYSTVVPYSIAALLSLSLARVFVGRMQFD